MGVKRSLKLVLLQRAIVSECIPYLFRIYRYFTKVTREQKLIEGFSLGDKGSKHLGQVYTRECESDRYKV